MHDHTHRPARSRELPRALIVLLAVMVFVTSGSTVAGAAWKKQSKKQTSAIDFVSATKGFAVAGGKLAYTTNGGKTWKSRSLPGGAYTLDFVSSSVGWATGGSKIYKTTNGGKMWKAQSTTPTVTWNEVCFVSKNNGWACGMGDEDWAIVRTTNGGTTWKVVASGDEGYMQALSFADKKHGVAGGGSFVSGFGSRVLTTHNGGLTWTEKFVAGTKLQSACMINSKMGWIGGYESGLVFRTKNGGKTWAKVKISKGAANDVNTITFTDKNHGWILAGKLFSTKNGGKTWKAIKSPVVDGNPAYLSTAAAFNTKAVWIGGYNGIWKQK